MLFENRDKLITQSKAINPRITASEYTEGADITSDYWIPKGSARNEADLFLYPYDEVKAVNELLKKDMKYNYAESSGTLPFEIFHKWSDKPSLRYPYAGWVLSLFNPELLSQIKKEHNTVDNVMRPGTLDYVLFHGEPLQEKPFACIAFERIEELKDRISECLPFEWNLNKWKIPALTDTDYWSEYIDYSDHGFCRKWDPVRGGQIQNCWHIPIRTLADIATFTMIGEEPVFKPWEKLQKTRYEYIKSKAIGRRIII